MVHAATMGDRQNNQQLLSIDEELWKFAEERAQEILVTIQPNVMSEVTRKEVIEYVQRLIRGYYGAELFPFGSVPLKTYLPDGDIDFTALSHENADADLAQTVCSILESNEDPEFVVKDIQYVRAQVPVVKCTVKDIAVDISFNQMAGLYALRFLEQVDQLLGKNHLFKRSIILIKAWCYYESRILGSHHGLLSTYALETLVLYIINRFHSSVRGPLEVLYRFLDYYSTFDWEKNYVSADGPKPLSSLPEIVETPDSERSNFLLNKEFLRNYRDVCSIIVKASETTTHEFTVKPLNILDPLKSDNNLGRSVNRANLHRIRFALSFGARKLKGILTLPGERMGAALERFFMNTLDRNGKGQRADIDVPVPAFGTGRSEKAVLRGDCDSYYGALQYVQIFGIGNNPMPLTALANFPSSTAQPDIHDVPTPQQQNWTMFYQGGATVYVPTQSDAYVTAQSDAYVPTQSDVYVTAQSDAYVPTQYDAYVTAESDAYAPASTNVYFPAQTDVYIPSPAFYHPNTSQATYSLEEIGVSRGTGTYIPDVAHNSYWDTRVKVHKPRRHAPVSHNVLPRSPQVKPPTEVHSDETADVKSNITSFELANEEFPLLSSTSHNSISQTPIISNETVDVNSDTTSFELAEEEFPLLPTIPRNRTLTARESIPVSIISNETTGVNGNTSSFELADEEFPLLPSVSQNTRSKTRAIVPVTIISEQARNSSSPLLNIEFGTLRTSESLAKLSLSRNNEKEGSGKGGSSGK